MGIFNKDFRQAAAAGGASSTAITLALTVTGATATQSWRKDDVEFSTSASVAVDPVTDGSTYSVVVVPTKNGVLGVAATATDVTFTYQWQYRDDDIGAWNSIGGATSATYVLADFVDERRYQCVVTGTNNRTAGTDRVISYYTTSDTYTLGAEKYIDVYVVAGGNGGGSGRKSAVATNASGGGGGCGGGLVYRRMLRAEISSPVTVTIGAGGAGGATQATNSTNGNTGAAGGTTSFGSYVSCAQPASANGGSTTTGTGTAGTAAVTIPASPYGARCLGSLGGHGNDSGSVGAGLDGNGSGTNYGSTGGGAGGGGGGCAATTGNEIAGGAGGGCVNYTTLDPGPTGGAIRTAGNVGANASGLSIGGSETFTYGLGQGGSGGGGDNQAAGSGSVNGGDGGQYGGGGGGGGGIIDGSTTTNKGGDGGPGLVIVIRYFGA